MRTSGPELKKVFAGAFILVMGLAAPASAAYNQSLTQQVTTANNSHSSIQGEVDPTNAAAQRFIGIPFAAPPVGALRWHAPADPPQWSGTRSATQFGNQCTQVSGLFDPGGNPATFGNITGSEDCLYLNVFRPNTAQSNLPVLYWIFGGANVAGGANDPIYEGAKFATTNNVVVVTASYRLGMLGFLYEKALHTGSNTAEDNSGNFATLDLVQGLNWVNSNITTFGGNVNNITIGGQSAGCINTWGLIQSPLALGKFQKAICMSGFPNMYSTAYGQGFAQQMEDRLLMDQNSGMTFEQADAKRQSMRSSQIAALLNHASAAQIMKDTPSPVVPGHFTDGIVISALFGVPGIFTCSYDTVPMIVGNVDTEGSLFVGMGAGWQVSQQTLWSMMNSGTPTPSDAVIVSPTFQQASGQPFSSSGYAQTSKALSDLVVFLNDQVDRYLQAQVLCSPGSVYRYQFKWKNVPQPWRDIYGSEHAIDLPFVFGNFSSPSFLAYAYTAGNLADRQDLSKLMNSYFADFLWNGDPNNNRSNPSPYANAVTWNAWTDFVGPKKRMMFNASLGKADAGRVSYMSNDEELAATTDILSLPPSGYTYAKSFLEGFIPQSWLTELGLSIPTTPNK
jgi:para-nitrobenzyl esterase